ncbi:MAG TPA: BMP family ABC transporter substrate-binding protein [Actinomycetota bacterium]|nr:BMP family ABC transporter substrate-binding protein [Actinomycetota bacterium]
MGSSARGRLPFLVSLLAVLALVATACGGGGGQEASPSPEGKPLTFGMILVGPKNDHGWSQAHFEAGKYVEQQLGARMIVIDKVNPADRPETSVEQVVSDMIDQGAQLIFATSDDMKDGIQAAAAEHPDVPMIWSSGDSAWAEGKGYRADLENLGNVMGRMEYGKMIAGCAAALTTQTGKIGYLGPLINDETRRLTDSAFLGARYCWENFLGNEAADLAFSVNWIGFWFNIPGVTLDPTQVTNDFFDTDTDVVISGIDTTEALVRAGQRAKAGDTVWAIPYDFEGACGEAPDVCLGVPYFNWGPAYLNVARSVQDGTFAAGFQWNGPDWTDINNPDTSAVGFERGPALSADDASTLDQFVTGLADGSINLYTGPLNWQDGSVFLGDGEVATDQQIWYASQLLEGMKGASSAD